jgi:formylglycine-generating enzyme required for sulfatase activity
MGFQSTATFRDALSETRRRTLVLLAGVSQDDETMAQTLQLAGLVGSQPTWGSGTDAPSAEERGPMARSTGLEFVEVPSGSCTLGAPAAGLADYQTFVEGGGYERREWWSADRECSEVFFGNEYRVLRGGSFATCAELVTPIFRNWDCPRRRQIFSGIRLARDL